MISFEPGSVRLLLNSTMHHCQWRVASPNLMLTQALTGRNMRSTSFHFIRHSLEGGMMPHPFPFVLFSPPSSFLSIPLDPYFHMSPFILSFLSHILTFSVFIFTLASFLLFDLQLLIYNVAHFLLSFLSSQISFYLLFDTSPLFSISL